MAHILVVDNDNIAAEHTAQVLLGAGHACGWVSDAEAAMKVVSRRRPDLILLDEHLPGESGTSFLRRLRGSPKFYDLPVIMLTSVLGFKEEQIAFYNGAQDYIRKPFGELALVFRVKELVQARGKRPAHQSLAECVGVEASPQPSPVRRII